MNTFLSKSVFTMVVAVCVLFGGQWASAGATSSLTVSIPEQQPRIPTGTSPTQPVAAPRNQRTRPRITTFARNALTPGIIAQAPGPTGGPGTNWAHWSELAWEATIMAVNTGWIPRASIHNVVINGANATCTFDCLRGPDLGPHVRSFLLSREVPVEVTDIFADSIAGAWKDWHYSVTIPGLPWYPLFLTVLDFQAPPTPNIPTPLIALPARQIELTSPERLAKRFFEQFRGAVISPDARNEIQRFSQFLATKFSGWLARAYVVNVLGAGPVPSWSPPFASIGPVINGYVLSAPGVITGNLY